jgi:L-threonine kinase
MASSTADIAAAVGLYQAFSRRGSDPRDVVRAALAVEPTDGVLFGGIVLFDHGHGAVLESWGDPPPLEVVAVQVGGPVDTVAFNARDLRKTARHHTRSILTALALIREGLATHSPSLIGHGATLSALCHQDVLPKPALEPLLKLALQEGGHGVNVAHSGSLVGLLFSPGRYDFARVFHRIAEIVPLPAPVWRLRIRGGGIETMRAA